MSGERSAPSDAAAGQGLRLDKWLWAARFFKTRSSAAEAIGGGHIHVDGERVKPARKVRAGDRLRIRRGPTEWEVIVDAVNPKRGPAAEAQTLYTETEESVARREHMAEVRKLDRASHFHGVGRPTRRQRQELERLRGRLPDHDA